MPKLTDTDIDDAISRLVEKKIRISTKNIRAEIGYGSFSSIQEYLRQRGYLKDKAELDSNKNQDSNSSFAHNHNSSNHDQNILYSDSTTSNATTQKSINVNDYMRSRAETAANKLVIDCQNDLNRYKTQNRDLKVATDEYNKKIHEPLLSANAVLEYYISMVLDHNVLPEIPGDLIRLLAEAKPYLTKKFPIIKNEDGDYFKDRARKLLNLKSIQDGFEV